MRRRPSKRLAGYGTSTERIALSSDEQQLEEKDNDWVEALEVRESWSIAWSCVAIVTGTSDDPRTKAKKP